MTDEEIERFRQKLQESLTFPTVYMYKFIVPSELKKIALVENLFEGDTDIHHKESSNGRYVSITAKQVVMGVDEIITIYKAALKIEGIMFL